MTLQISEGSTEYNSSVMNTVMASQEQGTYSSIGSKVAIPLLVLVLNAPPMGVDLSAVSANNFSADPVSYFTSPENSHSALGYGVGYAEVPFLMDRQDAIETLTGFASSMLEGMVPLDPEFAAAMDEEFWDLV